MLHIMHTGNYYVYIDRTVIGIADIYNVQYLFFGAFYSIPKAQVILQGLFACTHTPTATLWRLILSVSRAKFPFGH